MDERLTAALYEPAQAARLLDMHPARVRRWLFGYSYDYLASRREKGPLVQREGHEIRYASFLDLMELLFAKGFLEHGISVQKMRKALAEAKELYGLDHPFARRKFFTAGTDIFLEVETQPGGRKNLLHLLSGGQWAIAPVILHYAKQIDFAPATGEAERWWPLGKAVPVVLDPRVSFGAPTIAGRGVRTAVLFDLYLAERKKVDAVARWMKLEAHVVEAAIKFEKDRISKAA